MVEMLYGAPQWEIPQYCFPPCSIVSIYSTTMTNEMFPFLAPQLQEKPWWICSMVLLNGRFHKLRFFLALLVSIFSTTMTNEVFPLLAPQLQENYW